MQLLNKNIVRIWGAQYLRGENLKIVRAELSNLS
jgi:hypothetical protein